MSTARKCHVRTRSGSQPPIWQNTSKSGKFRPSQSKSGCTHLGSQLVPSQDPMKFCRSRDPFCKAQDQRRTKSTRKRNTPENADSRNSHFSAFSGVLRFRVLFAPLQEGAAKSHPKTQHTRNRRFWERPMICIFGCVAFSGVFCRLPTKPCVSKQCPADGVWRIGRGVSPDRLRKTRFTPSENGGYCEGLFPDTV